MTDNEIIAAFHAILNMKIWQLKEKIKKWIAYTD